jgi:hypothetical protein
MVGLHPDCFVKYHEGKSDSFTPKKRLNMNRLWAKVVLLQKILKNINAIACSYNMFKINYHIFKNIFWSIFVAIWFLNYFSFGVNFSQKNRSTSTHWISWNIHTKIPEKNE